VRVAAGTYSAHRPVRVGAGEVVRGERFTPVMDAPSLVTETAKVADGSSCDVPHVVEGCQERKRLRAAGGDLNVRDLYLDERLDIPSTGPSGPKGTRTRRMSSVPSSKGPKSYAPGPGSGPLIPKTGWRGMVVVSNVLCLSMMSSRWRTQSG
jgi:hypothetical protein